MMSVSPAGPGRGPALIPAPDFAARAARLAALVPHLSRDEGERTLAEELRHAYYEGRVAILHQRGRRRA